MSDAANWSRVRELFNRALDLDPPLRKGFLLDSCGGDAALHAEVSSLLAAHADAGSVAEGSPFDSLSKSAVSSFRHGLRAGDRLGPYDVVGPVGAGGMGEVYEARDTVLGRRVAIKILSADLATDGSARDRLLREAKALATLNHPNIAAIYGVETTGANGGGEPANALVLEIVDGQTLAERVARGPLPLTDVLIVGAQIAGALEAAHEKGIVHRDLKPANVKVTPAGTVKVLDFGLAKALDPDRSPTAATSMVTSPGTVLGTPAYMSPEQVRGEDVDKRTDVWALGCVLFELLTGRRAFGGGTASDCIAAVLEREPNWSALPPATPESIRALLRRCLQKDRGKRLRDIGDARLALEEASRPRLVWGVGATRWLWPGIVTVVTVMIVGGYMLASRSSQRQASSLATETKRIVVLPFENLGPPADEYFAGGLTEEITSRLAVVNGLGVISRNSAVQYAKSSKSTETIGIELRVDYILGGSVRWEPAASGGGRVRITPQLIRVSDDTHVWTQGYDRTVSEIFQVQSEIAERVAEELDLALLAPERRAIEARPTENIEAYQAYLRGVHSDAGVDRITESVTRRTAEMFEQAVALDPRFALAHARLSQTYSNLYRLGLDRSEERLAKARRAAEQALALQPTLPRGHVSLGAYHYSRMDYDAALREFAIAQRALQGDSDVQALVAAAHRRQGRFEEALADYERAMELNPRSAELPRERASTNVNLRRYAEAIRLYDVSIGVAPHQVLAFYEKGQSQVLATGAIREARTTLEHMPDTGDPLFAWTWLRQEMLERQYPKSLARVSSMPFPVIAFQDRFLPKALLLADLHRLLGESHMARSRYEEAALLLEREKTSHPDDARIRSALGMAYAGLGRKAEAILEARLGEELRPFSKDALVGPVMIEHLARVYTVVGEPEAALDQIERLLSGPIRFTVHMLELDPAWDPLRQRPRYRALLDKFGRTR